MSDTFSLSSNSFSGEPRKKFSGYLDAAGAMHIARKQVQGGHRRTSSLPYKVRLIRTKHPHIPVYFIKKLMLTNTKFICHIAPPKTAGQAIQAALRETRDIEEDDYEALEDAFIKDPPKTALIDWGHRWVSEIYTAYMEARSKSFHQLAGVYDSSLHPRDQKKSHTNRMPWPGKIFKKYWMEFLPDEMKQLGITECNVIPILSVVRNPFDRLFSIYNYYTQQHEDAEFYKPDLQFEEFILSFEDTYFRNDVMFGTCFDHISIENQIIATDILKFENLGSDFKAFCKKYDLPDIQLNRVNVNPNKKVPPVYTKEMIKIVERLFEKDLNEFDYSYDQFKASGWTLIKAIS